MKKGKKGEELRVVRRSLGNEPKNVGIKWKIERR